MAKRKDVLITITLDGDTLAFYKEVARLCRVRVEDAILLVVTAQALKVRVAKRKGRGKNAAR